MQVLIVAMTAGTAPDFIHSARDLWPSFVVLSWYHGETIELVSISVLVVDDCRRKYHDSLHLFIVRWFS